MEWDQISLTVESSDVLDLRPEPHIGGDFVVDATVLNCRDAFRA
jgi:hypothetical protein